jgi:hypothetical protein
MFNPEQPYIFDHPAVQLANEFKNNNQRNSFNQNILNNPFFNDPGSTSIQAALEAGRAGSSGGGGGSGGGGSSASAAVASGVTPETGTTASASSIAANSITAQILCGLESWAGFVAETSDRIYAPSGIIQYIYVTEGAALFSDGTIAIYSDDSTATLNDIITRSKQGKLNLWHPTDPSAPQTGPNNWSFAISVPAAQNTTDVNLTYFLSVSFTSAGSHGALLNVPANPLGNILGVFAAYVKKNDPLGGYVIHDTREKLATIADIDKHNRLGDIKLDLFFDPSIPTDYNQFLPDNVTPNPNYNPNDPNIIYSHLPSDPTELQAYDTAHGTAFYLKADYDYVHGKYAHRDLFLRKLEEYRHTEFVRISTTTDNGQGAALATGVTPGIITGNGIKASVIQSSPTTGPGNYPSLKLELAFDATHNGSLLFNLPGTTANTATLALPAQCAGKIVYAQIISNTTGRSVSTSVESNNLVLTLSKEYDLDLITNVVDLAHSHTVTATGTDSHADTVTVTGTTNSQLVGKVAQQLKEKTITGAITVQWTILG